MKTLKSNFKSVFLKTSLLSFVLLAFSCSQDTSSEDLNGAESLKAVEGKAQATRPIKAQLEFQFDYDYTPPTSIVLCGLGFPPEGPALFQTLVSGNMSHLGRLEPGMSGDGIPLSGSHFMPVSCSADVSQGLVLTTVYRSVYVAANGDELHATERVIITFTEERSGTFEGTGEVNGADSTGRFAGASGGWDFMNGIFDALPGGAGASWTMEGEITY